jgi:hypothetical protein
VTYIVNRKMHRPERRAVRVERAVKYLELRRERDLLLRVADAFAEQAEEGFLAVAGGWQTLPESLLLALWRYRGRWPTRLEKRELLEAVRRLASMTGQGELGLLAGGDPLKQVDIVASLTTHYILEELSFDGPVFTSFCGRLIMTPLSRSGEFADLRLGDALEV